MEPQKKKEEERKKKKKKKIGDKQRMIRMDGREQLVRRLSLLDSGTTELGEGGGGGEEEEEEEEEEENWRQAAYDRDGWKRAIGEALSLLDSGATE